jgi:hypothetical protein
MALVGSRTTSELSPKWAPERTSAGQDLISVNNAGDTHGRGWQEFV